MSTLLTNAIITGKLDGVVAGNIPKLCPDIQAVVFIGQKTSIIYDIRNIVGRRQSPTAILVHDKRKVFVVVISIISQDIEDHPSEHLLTV